jgi:hypothetical protein
VCLVFCLISLVPRYDEGAAFELFATHTPVLPKSLLLRFFPILHLDFFLVVFLRLIILGRNSLPLWPSSKGIAKSYSLVTSTTTDEAGNYQPRQWQPRRNASLNPMTTHRTMQFFALPGEVTKDRDPYPPWRRKRCTTSCE